jgi:hypothetical protein
MAKVKLRGRVAYDRRLMSGGQVYCRKVTKEFWPVAMSQPAKSNMAGFVLYLLGSFALRCSQHPAVSSQQSVKRKPTSKAFYRTRRPGRKAEPYAHVPARAVSTPDDCAKPTPFWDHLGCGGIPREGVPRRARLSPESPTSHVIAGIGR